MSDLGNQLYSIAVEYNEKRTAILRAVDAVDLIDRTSAEWMKCESVQWQGDLADAVKAAVSKIESSDKELSRLRSAIKEVLSPEWPGLLGVGTDEHSGDFGERASACVRILVAALRNE